MNTKLCRKCKKEKKLSEFNKCISRNDNLKKYCRDCTKLLRRKTRENKAQIEGRTMKPYIEKKFTHITDDELLDHLRNFYKIHKRAPVTSDFENKNNELPNMKTYYRHFKYNRIENKVNGWNDILELAGISPLNAKNFWTAWQYIVEKAVLLLEGECLFQYHGFSKDFKPDIYIPSKNKIIDAAVSNYIDKHKKLQFEKGIKYVDSIEYWCLIKKSKGLQFEGLKYVFADEIIERLISIKEFNLANEIKNINIHYTQLCEDYKYHRKQYCIKKIQEFYIKYNRPPIMKDLSHNPLYPSAANISDLFGSFNKGIIAAGFIPNDPIAKKKCSKN
ncbi:MAG: hypothetical protein ACRDCW_04860 [Sarcina sp.]